LFGPSRGGAGRGRPGGRTPGGRRSDRAGANVPYSTPNPPPHSGGDRGGDQPRHRLDETLHRVPALAELVAEEGEPKRPRQAPEQGVQRERRQAHPGHPGREADEGSDHGEQPAEEHGGLPVALEPVVRAVDLVRPQQEVPAPPIDQRAPARVPDPEGNPGADEVRERPDQGHRDEAQTLLGREHRGRDQRSAEQHRDLGGDGDAGRLEEHEHEDRHVAVPGDLLGNDPAEQCEHQCSRGSGNTPRLSRCSWRPCGIRPEGEERTNFATRRLRGCARGHPGGLLAHNPRDAAGGWYPARGAAPARRAPFPEKPRVVGMAKTLVVVESPTKAKTLERYLGSGYVVRASYGHIRDLPKSKLGVDTQNSFEPEYVVPEDSAKAVRELTAAHKRSGDLI